MQFKFKFLTLILNCLPFRGTYISKWRFKGIYTFHVLKNWNTDSFSVVGVLAENDVSILKKEIENIDNVIKGYEVLEHRENVIHALSLKYQVQIFLNLHQQANETIVRIDEYIDEYDLNALKSTSVYLKNGDIEYKRFVTKFSSHIVNLNMVIEKYDLGDLLLQNIPDHYWLNQHLLPRITKWISCDRFKLKF